MLERAERLALKQVSEHGGITAGGRAWATRCGEKGGMPKSKVLSVVFVMLLALGADKSRYREVIRDLLAVQS